MRAQKPPEWNPKLWSQPLFLGAMLCVGMYQFYNVRHRSKGNGGGFAGMGGAMDMPPGMMEKLKEAGVSPANIQSAMNRSAKGERVPSLISESRRHASRDADVREKQLNACRAQSQHACVLRGGLLSHTGGRGGAYGMGRPKDY